MEQQTTHHRRIFWTECFEFVLQLHGPWFQSIVWTEQEPNPEHVQVEVLLLV